MDGAGRRSPAGLADRGVLGASPGAGLLAEHGPLIREGPSAVVGAPGARACWLGGPVCRDAGATSDLAAHGALTSGHVDHATGSGRSGCGGGDGSGAPGRGRVVLPVSARCARPWRGVGAGIDAHGQAGRYRPMLAHLEGRRDRQGSPLRLRAPAPAPPPVLTPAQVEAILGSCARFEPEHGEWRGALRARLLFETLAETGVRLGEALCLTPRRLACRPRPDAVYRGRAP